MNSITKEADSMAKINPFRAKTGGGWDGLHQGPEMAAIHRIAQGCRKCKVSGAHVQACKSHATQVSKLVAQM
jgi:hypothetical protein